MTTDLVWGAQWGLTLSVAYGVVNYLRRYPGQFWDGAPAVVEFVVMYVCGGLAGGMVCGLLRPKLTSGWASAGVGFLSVLPAITAHELLARRDTDSLGISIVVVCITSFIFGCGGAALFWNALGAKSK